MTSKDDFAELRSLLSRVRFNDYDLREKIFAEIDKLASSYFFYKDAFFNGKDSDDASGCRMCTNDEESFIHLDLEEGLQI